VTVIIGIAGNRGVGKTTSATYLKECHGARVYAFATPLKELVRRAFKLSEAQLYGTQEEKLTLDPRYNVSPSWLLEHIGTQGCRGTFGDDFFVERTVAQIRKDAPALAIVEDVRFLSEAAGLRAVGGKVWKLHRAPDVKAWPSDHQSETELEQIVADLDLHPGAGGVEQLYHALDMACRYQTILAPRAKLSAERADVDLRAELAAFPESFWKTDPELDASVGRALLRRDEQRTFRKLTTSCATCGDTKVRLRPDGLPAPCQRCA